MVGEDNYMSIVPVCRGLPTSGSKLQGRGNGLPTMIALQSQGWGNGIPTNDSIKVAGVG